MPGRLFTREKHRADQNLGESKENSFQGWFVGMFVVCLRILCRKGQEDSNYFLIIILLEVGQ